MSDVSKIQGYDIKDSFARENISLLNQDNIGRNFNLVNNIIYDTNSALYTQGCCLNGNELYVYQNINDTLGNLLVFDIVNHTLIKTIDNIKFYHGGDLIFENNFIYCATSGGKKTICKLDLSTNLVVESEPFSSLTQFTETLGFGNFDENNFIVLLGSAPPVTNFDDKGLYLLNKHTNEITELTITNTKNFDLNFYCYQSMEYKDNSLYCLTSEPNMIIKLVNKNNVFNIDRVYNIPTFDELGLQIGEVEGLALIENKRFVITSHINNNTLEGYKTLKTYFIDLDGELQNPKVRTNNLYNSNTLYRTEVICNANANPNTYYENGTPEFPFKDLKRAISYVNKSPFAIGKQIVVSTGSYKIGRIDWMEATIVAQNLSTINNVVISGVTEFINCKINMIGNPVDLESTIKTISMDKIVVDGGECILRQVTFNNVIDAKNTTLSLYKCDSTINEVDIAVVRLRNSMCYADVSSWASPSYYYFLYVNSVLFVNKNVSDSKINKASSVVWVVKTA